MEWDNTSQVGPEKYVCGYCGKNVASDKGYTANDRDQLVSSERVLSGVVLWKIVICPLCQGPTFVLRRTAGERPVYEPAPPLGNRVDHVPDDIEKLYDEARRCGTVSAYTAAVMACRKLLMHIAVDKEAPEGKKFIEYVEYLSDNHYVPPNGKDWVDHIRKKGNEANHEINIMDRGDALDLINFIEMLLKLIYEFPGRLPKE